MDYDQLFPGRFMKAGEFQGKDVTLTIASVELEDLPQDKGGDKTRGIIGFKETKKKLVLNRTNGECLKAMFGRDTDAWLNRRVTLFPSEWNGEPAIRVKGSPEIDKPLAIEVKLPKRRPIAMTMLPTGKKSKAAAAAAREPGSDDDADFPGELPPEERT